MSATALPTGPIIRPDALSNDDPALFSREELQEFAADDIAAGRTIGKILAALFIYTVIAMSVAILWTINTLSR